MQEVEEEQRRQPSIRDLQRLHELPTSRLLPSHAEQREFEEQLRQ